jgi:hypothetical protein
MLGSEGPKMGLLVVTGDDNDVSGAFVIHT